METNGPPNWLPPQILLPDQHHVDSHPGSAASVASSASSFRIPAITPVAQTQPQQQHATVQHSASTSSFVRLFTSQPDANEPLFRPRGRKSSPTVDWLAKHGPSPRELLESSQGPSDFLRIPQQPLRISDGRLGRTLGSPSPGPVPPTTPQGERPFTASSYHRSKLVTADGSVGSYVCAILENRGTGREVGIASLERETGLCVITQFADTPTYVRTIHHLSMYPPNMLLVPASGISTWKSFTSASASRKSKRPKTGDEDDTDSANNSSRRDNTSVLIRCLEELFEIEAWPFPRKHWSYLEGARYLDRLLVDDADQIKDDDEGLDPAPSQEGPSQRPTSSRPMTGRGSLDLNAKASTRAAILVAVANKFYLLSAVAGLFDFFTEKFNRIFTPRSLRISFVVPESTMLINSNTAHDLELVRNLIDPRSKDSLYGLLDHYASPMGQRLLKMNILQPLTDLDTISARQEAVTECIRNEERFYAIKESLKPIKEMSIDLDKLLHTLSFRKKREAEKREETEKKISCILSLRTLLRSLAPARAALQNSSSGLLRAVSGFLESEELDRISESIFQTIDGDIIHAKGGLGSRQAQMYSVRAERSPLLDVARETYRENIDDIEQLRQRESRDTGLNLSLRLISSGFLFQTKLEASQMSTIPEHFTNISRAKSGKLVTMMTLALKKLNARLVDSMTEVCTMSDILIEQLIDSILSSVASLYKVSEALSLLDMIVSFAHVSIANDYVRPSFSATLDIRNARHPILDRVGIPSGGSLSVSARKRRPFVPNDIYLAPGERVCMVTGPNMSGKSTFLRQIALITVLAGIGCFVPATRASLPIPDALLSLLTHEDDATQNLSTFAAEMRTTAFILSVSTPRSLVILDEMGRGTSPDEGVAIATAIVEEMVTEKGCTMFFATHFGELVDGLEGKEGVVCQHLSVSTVKRDDTREDLEGVGLVFHHKLQLGRGLESFYSLQVARMMGCFSAGFLKRAQEVARAEQRVNGDRRMVGDGSEEGAGRTRERRKLLRRVVRDLRRLVKGPGVKEFGEEAVGEQTQGAQNLMERLAQLQLDTAIELDESFND